MVRKTMEQPRYDTFENSPLEVGAPSLEAFLARSMPLAAPLLSNRREWSAMPVDIKESSTTYTFTADLPGVSKEDIRVLIEPGDVLTISAERKQEGRKEERDLLLHMERVIPAKYRRRFSIPKDADIGKITAIFEDGVLTALVPKVAQKEPLKSRVVQVKGASGWRGQSRL